MDPTTSRIPSFLLNIRLQHALLRVACISALALLFTLAVVGGYPPYVYVLPFFTTVYHISYAFYLRLFLPGAVDLAVIFLEVGSYFYFSYRFFPVNNLMPFPFVLIKVLGWTIFSNFLPIIVLRIAQIHERKNWGTPERRADTPDTTDFKIDRILLGSLSPRKKLFHGESSPTRISRAIFAGIIVLAMSIFSSYNIIIEPMRETASPPVKEVRSFLIPPDVLDYMYRGFVLDVLFTVPTPQITVPGAVVNMSILLTAIEVSAIDGDSRRCSNVPEPGFPLLIPLDHYYDLMPSLTFNCPRNYVPIPGQPAGYVEQVPTILASVNFTKLSGFVTDYNSKNLSSPSLVQVMLGFTKKTKHVLRSTSPVPLIPGMNIVALSNVYIRQSFNQPALSAFGLFDVYEYFPVSDISYVFPDPETPTASPNITRGPDVANIRILSPNDFSDWKLIQDYREKSVLKGFAVVGGLWTFLCGVFATIYGPSLMQILFGVKPLSVFGLIHTLSRRERESLFSMYRHLYIDLAAGRAERGFRAFLADFVIDFGPIESGATSRLPRHQPISVDIEPENQNLILETRRSSEIPTTSTHLPSR